MLVKLAKVSMAASMVDSVVASITSTPLRVPVPVNVRVSVDRSIEPKSKVVTPVEEDTAIVLAVSSRFKVKFSSLSEVPSPIPVKVMSPSVSPATNTPADPRVMSSVKVGELLNTTTPEEDPVSSDNTVASWADVVDEKNPRLSVAFGTALPPSVNVPAAIVPEDVNPIEPKSTVVTPVEEDTVTVLAVSSRFKVRSSWEPAEMDFKVMAPSPSSVRDTPVDPMARGALIWNLLLVVS